MLSLQKPPNFRAELKIWHIRNVKIIFYFRWMWDFFSAGKAVIVLEHLSSHFPKHGCTNANTRANHERDLEKEDE